MNSDKKRNKISLLGLLTLLLLAPGTLFAEELVNVEGVLICDPIFRPPGCVNRGNSRVSAVNNVHNDGWENLRANTGIIVQPETAGIDFGGLNDNFQIPDSSSPSGENGGGNTSGADVYNFNNSSVSGVDDSTDNAGTNPENQSGEESEDSFDQSPRQQAQGQGSGTAVSGLGGATGNNVGLASVKSDGLLYSNDSQDAANGSFKQGTNPGTVKAPNVANGQSAVMLNRQNNTASGRSEDKNSEGGNQSRGLASVPGGPGRFSSSGSSAGNSANTQGGAGNNPNGLLDRLTGIARNLGEKFFGFNGSARTQSRAEAAAAERNRLKQLAAISKNDPNFRNLLQKHMRQRRGLASPLEFGSSNSKIFNTVCQNYRNYAKENSITKSIKTRCPDI